MTESFGARFKRLRKNKGLTQEDIAKEFNITPQSVSKWENDLSAPDITILVDLAKLLDVSVDVLLGKEEFNPTKICLESERKNIENIVQNQVQSPLRTSVDCGRISLRGKRRRLA